MTTLAEALATIASADPAELMKAEMHRAVSDVDFTREAARQPPGPSMAGLDPRNRHIIEAKERALAEQIERDRLQAAQREPSLAAAVEVLAAGQSPENVHNVRQSVRTGT